MKLTAASLPLAEGANVSDAQIGAALGIVEACCGWQLEKDTTTVVVDSEGSDTVWLPSLHVTDVASVQIRTDPETVLVDDVDYSWASNGALHRLRGTWPAGNRALTVTFTGGYEPLPAVVLAVVASVAGRLTRDSSVRSVTETVGGITTTDALTTDGAGLTSVEEAALDRYRIRFAR